MGPSVCVHAHTHTWHVHTHLWGTEIIFRWSLFIGTFHLPFETRSLTGLELTNKTRLAYQRIPVRTPKFNSPALRLQALITMLGFLLWWWLVDWFVSFFTWALGTKLGFSSLQGKPFTHWASPEAWTCLLNTIIPPLGLWATDCVKMVSMVTYRLTALSFVAAQDRR